jgi:hypothetical protein
VAAGVTGPSRRERAHTRLGFTDFDTYLKALIKKDRKEAARRFQVDPKSKRGNPTGANQYQREDSATVANSTQADRPEANGVSHYTQRMLDRLARDRPDLLEEVQAAPRRRISAMGWQKPARILG